VTSLTLLVWSGCPSHDRALASARTLLDDLGYPQTEIDVIWVETEQDAVSRRFVGSPSFRWDDEELIPTDDAWYGLACRLYRHRDGRGPPFARPRGPVRSAGPKARL
jgi:hypothetical protein